MTMSDGNVEEESEVTTNAFLDRPGMSSICFQGSDSSIYPRRFINLEALHASWPLCLTVDILYIVFISRRKKPLTLRFVFSFIPTLFIGWSEFTLMLARFSRIGDTCRHCSKASNHIYMKRNRDPSPLEKAKRIPPRSVIDSAKETTKEAIPDFQTLC